MAQSVWHPSTTTVNVWLQTTEATFNPQSLAQNRDFLCENLHNRNPFVSTVDVHVRLYTERAKEKVTMNSKIASFSSAPIRSSTVLRFMHLQKAISALPRKPGSRQAT